ncbi:DNA topoisomerase IV [Pseudomonas daroniae]|uniref:DNA topoisomerase IV n=1 Tax=Phytopseudomonas daroniae TaxID=2487519 RepID=A0A4Q9QT84_9GAMM|nr:MULTISPECIES: esterase-like activity of phytase family protein [Pseudomonas]TBU79059.1 DNA topoisomerase IV [Pseudomonas daroniae]TBU83035.1 DNA topoisomerase IV [Pseudomonas sp. FRB 228]TBU83952.1 DNA topoisomerase IV [Pseudomonas daroniae]TBU93130.1 DNA topoisomerase IV [Pseudomonas daroniae]
MRHLLGALLLASVTPLLADTPALEELKLLSEHPVAGMDAGNLSGLAWCGDALWAVSDREDDRLYRLDSSDRIWQAEVEHFVAPPAPVMPLPWGLRMRAWVSGLVRGGHLDFEGISCDAKGNRYLVSESRAAVLQVPPAADAQWLTLPEGMVRQARASGMLLHFNSLFEGIAVDPAGERLWLAAEKQRRGLVVLHHRRATWLCEGGCVLLSEGGQEASPEALGGAPAPVDFSGLAFHNEKLFTLERQAHRICRRTPATGDAERCWSFAAEALTDERRYPMSYGVAEALSIDEEGAWVGVDNGGHARGDGEKRPVVWRFAAPAGGWGVTR